MDAELERRYSNVRTAMAEHDLDALIVAGSEYSGFEGSVTYLSGFQIVHRYAYVVVPADGEPQIVFPTEARYVGEHGTAQLEQVFHDRPGEHIAATARDQGWNRIGVYGLDYIMTVRDFRAFEGPNLIPFDAEFDLARAVKSDAELESVRESVRINEDGFEAFLAAYEPGKTAAEAMAPAEELFVERGCGRLTMNMVLIGPEFGIAKRRRCSATSCCRRSRSLGRGCTGWRCRARSAPSRTKSSRWSRHMASTTPPPARRCATAPRHTTFTAPSRRALPTAATTSGTSPATRSG